jgi:hypothetical protein
VECHTRSIYHLLCRTFGKRVAIAQIVYFNVADVVAICDVHLPVDRARAVAAITVAFRRSWW